MFLSRRCSALVLALSTLGTLGTVACGPGPEEMPEIPPGLQLQGPGRPETKTMSPTCGPADTLMVIGYSGDVSPDPSTCGDAVVVGGVTLTGRKTYNAEDNRWTLAVTVPEGVSGDVVVACGRGQVPFGKFTQPCPPEGGRQSAFEAFRGDLTMTGNCDDADKKVSLSNFTITSFEMTGLSGNEVVRFRIIDDKTAVSSDVVQFGQGGHSVRLVIGADGKLQFTAQSSAGSCAATLSTQ